MKSTLDDVSAVELLYRLANLPPMDLNTKYKSCWQNMAPPLALQAYYQYLDFTISKQEKEAPIEALTLQTMLSARSCCSSRYLPDPAQEEEEDEPDISKMRRAKQWRRRIGKDTQLSSSTGANTQEKEYFVFAQGPNWWAGIEMERLGEEDPPVWLRVMEDSAEKWIPLTDTTQGFLKLLLMEELSGGRNRYHRIPISMDRLSDLLPMEDGWHTCWLEEEGCVLFLFQKQGLLRAMRVDKAHTFVSEDSWRTSYLLDHHLKPSSFRPHLEPFSLASYCEDQGYQQIAQILRMENIPSFDLEFFENPQEIREFRYMDTTVSGLEALSVCLKLKDLWMPRNRLEDLSHLRELTNLRTLSLSNNRIHSLEPLAGLLSLGYLDLSGNPVTSEELSHLRKLKRLGSLLLNDTLVDDLSPLQGYRCSSLELTGQPLLNNAEVLNTRTRLQALRLDLVTERALGIGEMVPWLNIRVEYNGIVELTNAAYYG